MKLNCLFGIQLHTSLNSIEYYSVFIILLLLAKTTLIYYLSIIQTAIIWGMAGDWGGGGLMEKGVAGLKETLTTTDINV